MERKQQLKKKRKRKERMRKGNEGRRKDKSNKRGKHKINDMRNLSQNISKSTLIYFRIPKENRRTMEGKTKEYEIQIQGKHINGIQS